jgi:hypothetical protein
MNSEPRQISVIDPISPTFERIKQMLFRPFDLKKWFAVGFCAWLAYLGEGGANFNFRVPWDNCGPTCGTKSCTVESVRQACPANVLLAVFIGVMILVIFVAVWLVLLWLSSRGRFMFLNCVARNSDKIKAPWRDFGRRANSLFLFRLVMWVIGTVFILGPMLALFLWCTSASVAMSDYHILFWAPFVLGVLLVSVIGIILLIIMKFTKDFVVPIMYIHKVRCMEAWGRFRSILSANKGRFTLYILFQIVIGLAIRAIVMTVVLATCCCAACIFAIPYIGTVVMLPLFVFKRAYSLYYLRQYGSQFDVFAEDEISDSDMILEPE